MTIIRHALALVLAVAAAGAAAQDYPSKPLRIITSTPGNFHDIVARHLARHLGERWGQPVVVENRGGAGATIAATAAAQSPADGYTLLVTDRTALTMSPTLMRNLAYDPFRDLAPVSLLAAAPMILAAHSSVAAKDMRELISLWRSPTPTHLASAGPATGPHLLGELLKQATGANVVNVHYKGSPAAMTGLLGGEAKAGFMLVPVVLPHVQAGRVKAYAITGRSRFAQAPDIPTVAEVGLADLESELWLALMTPAGTPESVVMKLHREVVDFLKLPGTREAMLVLGAEPLHSSPQELAAYMRSETARWKAVIERAEIKIQ